MEEIAYGREVEYKNALKKHDVRWVDCDDLIVRNGVRAVVILIYRDLLAFEDVSQGAEHEILVESVRVVEVEAALRGTDLLLVSQFPVKAVLRN